MAAVSDKIGQQLEDIFGERMRTDRVERKMYSFDIGAMPSMVRPFVATGVAGAVVRPESEEQIIALMRACTEGALRRRATGVGHVGIRRRPAQDGAVVVGHVGNEGDPQRRSQGPDRHRAGLCDLGRDRAGTQEGRPGSEAIPIIRPRFERRRVACAGRGGIRIVRVRDLQGQRRLRTSRAALRRRQGLRGRRPHEPGRGCRGHHRHHHRGHSPNPSGRARGRAGDRVQRLLCTRLSAACDLRTEAAGLVDHVPQPGVDPAKEAAAASSRPSV